MSTRTTSLASTNLRHSPRSILARSYTCRMLPDDVSHSLKKAWIVACNSRLACSPNPASLSAERKLATARTFVSSAWASDDSPLSTEPATVADALPRA